MFQRFFDEGLAQASFLIGCDRTKEAVVIDPRRDASVYAAAARQAGMRIVAAIETHVHADFVSGARELARTGARVIAGPGSDLQFEHHEVRDGEQLTVGDFTLMFLHTPGHTPEHVCVQAETAGQSARLFTGDLLFVGGVGRPDLLGEAQTRQLANELFTSLQRVMALDDRTEVHPGHGAGSLCGAGIGRDPASSIGRERQQNALLQYRERDAFVAAVLADIPETPSYFSRMKRVNAAGPPILGLVDGDIRVPSLKPGAAAALAADGAVVIDLRSTDAFAAGHPYGALNIAYGPKVGYWAGWVVPDGTPMILLSDDPVHARAAAVQLLRVGLDRIEGTIVGGYDAWTADGLPGATVDRITAGQLRVMPMCIVDVRTPAEWRAGHVEGSINIPVGDILLRAHELVGDTPVATICEGGYRSSLAASLLLQEGVSHVVNVIGGMAAYRDLERI